MNIKFVPGNGNNANGYIINGSILVDAGVTPMAIQGFLETIQYIVLTHCHYDHIAYLSALVKVTGAKICIHPDDADGLKNDTQSLSYLFGDRSPGLTPDMLLNDGGTLEGYQIIHTPGHTPGSICLYDPVSKDLISGDTVFSDGCFGRYDFPNGSKERLEASLNRLAEFEVSGLYPGHGIPIRDSGGRQIKAAQMMIKSGYL